MQSLLFEGEGAIREDIDRLMAGEWLAQILSEHLVFQQLTTSKEAVLNLLLASGYLKCRNVKYDYVKAKYRLEVRVHNEEIRHVFATSVDSWLGEQVNRKCFDDTVNYTFSAQATGAV